MPDEGNEVNELGVPQAAERDDQSWELMRVWVAERGLHCALKVGVYESEGIGEERAWGIVLADAARHLADAVSSFTGRDRDAALSAIRLSMEDELNKPTSRKEGAFRD